MPQYTQSDKLNKQDKGSLYFIFFFLICCYQHWLKLSVKWKMWSSNHFKMHGSTQLQQNNSNISITWDNSCWDWRVKRNEKYFNIFFECTECAVDRKRKQHFDMDSMEWVVYVKDKTGFFFYIKWNIIFLCM